MFSISCVNTHHDVTTSEVDEMVSKINIDISKKEHGFSTK